MAQEHRSVRSPKADAERIVAYMLRDHRGNWAMDIDEWDWVPGVGVIALEHYYRTVGDARGFDVLAAWVERNRHKAERAKVVNAMAPYAIFPSLYARTGVRYFLEEGDRIASWIVRDAPRTREGALEHTVTEPAAFPEQVWADTVFMAVLFLARMGRAADNREYGEEALRQLLLHLRLLQDERTGVLFHGWDCGAGNHVSAARWTRANAWVTLATPMILDEAQGWIAVNGEIEERYAALLRGLKSYQADDGLWPTVMDRPAFYPEASGSAGIAAGFAMAAKRGWADASYAAAAARTLEAIRGRIGDEGEVRNVSTGTPVMPTVEHYDVIPQCPTLYGQGLALLLLAEHA